MKRHTLIISFLFLLVSNIAAITIKLNDVSTKQESLSIYNDRIGADVEITGNLEQLNYFYNSLKQTSSKKVRIAHFGDSLILGDIITSDLRSILQNQFGGRGIGFIAACNDDIMFRTSINHKFSNDWEWASVFTRNPKRYPLSINGIMSIPAADSKVTFESGRLYEPSKNFKEIRIFYDKTNENSIVNIKTEFDSEDVSLSQDDGVFNEVSFTSHSEINSVDLTFKNSENSLIYGISLENGTGIYVDNFAMRGNSGASISKIDEKFVSESQKDLYYSLIILNFGINIVEAGKTDYTWYKKKMIRNIEMLKDLFPETSILLVSAGHKGVKRGSKIISDSTVYNVVEVQKEIVEKTGIAFWNLYDAMGGSSAIVDWVNAGYVAKDYIHFNQKGGEKVANMLVKALMNARN
jgi:lysophospholipase L1-like esterase